MSRINHILFVVMTTISHLLSNPLNLWRNTKTGIISKYFSSCWQDMHTAMHIPNAYINTKFMYICNSSLTLTVTCHKIKERICCCWKKQCEKFSRHLWKENYSLPKIKLSLKGRKFGNKVLFWWYMTNKIQSFKTSRKY